MSEDRKWDIHITRSIKRGWALLVPESPLGEIEIVEWDTGAAGNYDRMRAAVDGYIEAVDVPALDATIWVNEEGLLQGRPLNRIATILARMPDPRDGWVGDYALVGPALITGGTDQEGETMALSTRQIEAIKDYLDRFVAAAWFHPQEVGDE
jgi:hypothetical protein